MTNPNNILETVNNAGFDGALALATDAEVTEGAACGQLCLINEALVVKSCEEYVADPSSGIPAEKIMDHVRNNYKKLSQ